VRWANEDGHVMRLGRGVVLLGCVVASCGGGGATTPFPGRVPANHRASSSTCLPRVETDLCPPSEASSECATDQDCVEGGLNGSCLPGVRGSATDAGARCTCVYDRCATDADCRGSGPCQCNAADVGNACLLGNCVIDADCGAGGFCSPVVDPCTGLARAYVCHTRRDTCLDNTDCGTVCTFVDADGRWECSAGAPNGCPTLHP
jgi:hypothetical protein